MPKFFRFLFLNIYSFLLLFCGIILIILPLWEINLLILIPQILLFIFFIKNSVRIFSAYKSKLKELKILCERNKKSFRKDTFEIFMKAPCGRLLVRCALKDLNQKEKYKDLLIYQPRFKENFIQSFKPKKTKITFADNLK